MPPGGAAAAASRRRNQPGRKNGNPTLAPDVSKGMLVMRTPPVPKRSTKKSKDGSSKGSSKKNKVASTSTRKLAVGESSFRQKMSSRSISASALKAGARSPCNSDDEKSLTSTTSKFSTRSKRSTTSKRSTKSASKLSTRSTNTSNRRALLVKQESSSKILNVAGFRRFLSRGNSSRTDDTFQSLGTLSDRLPNPATHPPPPLSACFPPSITSEKYLIRRPTARGEFTTIENQYGTVVGLVEETHYGRRLLKNADGKVCAMILLHQQKYETNTFSICGLQPVVYKQSMKFDQVGFGYYKWADVKNAGGFGGTISLKHVKDEITSHKNDHTFCTKMFGSVFRLKKTRGHVVLDDNKKECAKLIALPNTGRAVQIAPKQDVAMMLCYSVIIDEILENRMR
mmetsp:Transcript_21351/g.52576  ORF Transcript_21351/g.52576 Transcript_21351/m.52576 type:complete len:398 (+) Transcript_21351:439-1632(+)|eukprot:CAMPEP_0113623312 /NCGR_PEP_ID=MMETSP0017_2-20120614/11985_1 /TAXON_ID=2856 /ORGANISM="Cylindrotheca closterium" /LENGTH=397 /DNA_ID=CAMNT_0000533243 /DNA_START=286 /DNA_END=1479 /DNA_ORIENTATION=+ /assembly_acc=CAM_ASM_000147